MLDKIGVYFHTSSFIHKMNPAIKIITTLILLITGLVVFNIYQVLTLTLFILILIIITKVPLSLYLRVFERLIYPILIIIGLTLIISLSIKVTFFVFVKLILIILTFSLLIKTTTLTELLYGFEKVLKPFKKWEIKPKKHAWKIVMGLKYLCDLLNSYSFKETSQTRKELEKVMKVRMFDLNRGRTHYNINKGKVTNIVFLSGHILLFIVIILEGVLI